MTDQSWKGSKGEGPEGCFSPPLPPLANLVFLKAENLLGLLPSWSKKRTTFNY